MTSSHSTDPEWDAFISHASEDKEAFVRPLAETLSSLGARIWYDETSLSLGDSLSQSIDKGLARSRYGVVVVSSNFMRKPWTQHELSGLWTRDLYGHGRILPIWHGVDRDAVAEFSPTLADRVALVTAGSDAADIALKILAEIRPDLHAARSREALVGSADAGAMESLQSEIENLRDQLSEFQCPRCGAELNFQIDAPIDDEHKHWDLRRTFACGYQDFAGLVETECQSVN
jgi:TIR domain